jgi:cytidyltransferase-like protein
MPISNTPLQFSNLQFFLFHKLNFNHIKYVLGNIKNMRILIPVRLQPLHKGHRYLIEQALRRGKKLVILIGSSQYYGTRDNPFTFEERKQMVKLVLDRLGANYEIVPMPDVHDDKRWKIPPFIMPQRLDKE